MITVREFCQLFTDPNLQHVIVDDTSEDGYSISVFEGVASDLATTKYGDELVQSVDTLFDETDTVVINICSI